MDLLVWRGPLLLVMGIASCGYVVAETITPGAGPAGTLDAAQAGSSDADRATLPPATRNKLDWPFAAASIWNMPIGGGAVYAPAMMTPPGRVAVEKTFFVLVGASDPERDVFAPGSRISLRCSGTTYLGTVRVPDSFVLSAADNQGTSNSTSLLMPDGQTLRELSGVARCTAGGPVYAYPFAVEDILGLGLRGGQGGSGMSAVGGSLRAGELSGSGPIRHALKMIVWGDPYLFNDPANPAACYRWPADRCDAGASDPGPFGYHGQDPRFVQGTLLALPPALTANQLAIETRAGSLLFAASQDYGVYVVGNSGEDAVAIAFESLAVDDFQQKYGYPPMSTAAGSDAWASDVRKMVAALNLVTNNGPNAVGGGGAPRRELAPPFAK